MKDKQEHGIMCFKNEMIKKKTILEKPYNYVKKSIKKTIYNLATIPKILLVTFKKRFLNLCFCFLMNTF